MVVEITSQINPRSAGTTAPAMSIVPTNNTNKPSNDVDSRQDQSALGKDVPFVSKEKQDQSALGKDVPFVSKEKEDEAPVTKQEVVEAVQTMQEYAQSLSRDLEFKIDEDSGRTVITVTDTETDEVVRQIPSEEVLNVIASLRKNGGLMAETSA